MPLKQKIAAVTLALALFVFILSLLRRRKLREEYTWLWLLTGAGIVVLALWYRLLETITALIGAVWPTSTLFFFGLLFLICVCLQFSVKLSALSNQVKNLTQELAILRADLGREPAPGSEAPDKS